MADKREFIYEDANEQHARALIVYGKSTDNKLYYDPQHTEQVGEPDALRFFLMDALVVKTTDGYSRPVFVNTVNHKVVTLTKSGSSVLGTEWSVAEVVADEPEYPGQG